MKKDIYVLIGIIVLIMVGVVSSSTYKVIGNALTSVPTNIVINEVVVDPQTDWDGNAAIGSNDEWFELYNSGLSDVNLTGWNLSLIDNTNETETISGIILAQSYFTILNPPGQQDNNDGRLILYDNLGNLIDSVSYGNYNDGNVGDNAQDGNANNINDECLARIVGGVDTNIDKNDFFKTSCTFNSSNNVLSGDITINGVGNYATIQSAINAANAGDVVNVGVGSSPYNENLIINKGISLIGENTSVIINGVHIINSSNVNIQNITFTTTATVITIDSSLSIINNINIKDSIFNLSNAPSIGIYIGGGNPLNKVSNIVMDNNVFNGPTSKNCNPWKIGGDFVSGGLSAEIDSIDFINNEVNRCSIPVNLQNKDINDIFIDNNIFKNTDGVIYFWAENSSNPSGVLSNFVFTNNDVDGTNTYGIGIDNNGTGFPGPEFDQSNFGNGNKINYNYFSGIIGNYGFGAVSILSALTTYKLNAEKNYWGACDGPSGNGSGSGSPVSANVDFTPWIGICFANKTNESCAFEDRSAQISAELSGYEINKVWFSYFINGVNYNKTALHVGGNKYSYSITASELVKGNVTWNVYANDSFGNMFNNSWKTFYVKGNTDVIVTPLTPNGLNGWYITEPLFSLLSDAGLNSYYKWSDSGSEILYIAPFKLENIPNPPNVTAGKLKLIWWSEFVCGNETKQNKTFYIDLTSPVIEELTPENNSVVYQNDVLVSAYLDEVYGTNSGINLSTVVMKIDDGEVNADVNVADTLDATVSFNTVNLSDGLHNASVYAVDKSGRVSELTWFFNVDTSLGDFKLIVNSPADGIYGDKRIEFNLNVSRKVNEIEYINYNDRNPDWKRLCKDCDEYGSSSLKRKTLNEGWNNLSFRAVNDFGFSEEVNRMVFIDSKKPKISKILPKKNSVTNGSNFYVKYTEENLKDVLISFNPVLPVDSCDEAGENKECYFNLDLSSYNGQEIEYSINVSDKLRSVESDKIKIKVDTSSPVLTVNSPENKTGEESYNKKVPFNISVSEEVILEYYDETFSRPIWKKLCSKCNSYGVDKLKTKSFDKGVHEVLIRAVDGAGNSDVEMVRFEVV